MAERVYFSDGAQGITDKSTIGSSGQGTYMKKVIIKLKDIKDITKFVSILNSKKGEFDLSCGQAYVDGKSILGVLSLDIKRPLALNIYTEEDTILTDLKSYLIENSNMDRE